MKKVWFDEAWADYLYWQSQDKKTLKRINELLRDIERSNFEGIGKPEPLFFRKTALVRWEHLCYNILSRIMRKFW